MKIVNYTFPKSSFLAMEKDMSQLVDLILKNDRLKNLLYYNTKDCLSKPKLTEDQSLDLFGSNIRMVPVVEIDENLKNYIIITFDDFTPNKNNPEFRDSQIEIDIYCQYDQWLLKDFQLRPYKIAAEIDSMIDNKKFSGIGTLQFLGATKLLRETHGGLCLLYTAVHGEEDRKNASTSTETEAYEANFNKIFNEKK